MSRARRALKRRGPSPEPDPAYLGLRGRLLGTTPGQIGVEPSGRWPRAWAVLVDLPVGVGYVSIVGVADGSTSMYTSTGGGIIGAGARPAVRAATGRLLDVAEAGLAGLPLVDACPLPSRGNVGLVILARDGSHRIEASEDALAVGPGIVARLYAAAQDVITQLQLVDAERA